MSQTNAYTNGDEAPRGNTGRNNTGDAGGGRGGGPGGDAGRGAGGYTNGYTNGVSAASTRGYQINPDTSRSPGEFHIYGNVRAGSYGTGSVTFNMRSAQNVPHLGAITLTGLDESGARDALGGWTDGMLVDFIIHGVTHEVKRIQLPRFN